MMRRMIKHIRWHYSINYQRPIRLIYSYPNPNIQQNVKAKGIWVDGDVDFESDDDD